MDFLEKVLQPQNEMELFFASMCKTVQKFNPLDQAKTKLAISRIVGDMEIANIENSIAASGLLSSQCNFSIESLSIDNYK